MEIKLNTKIDPVIAPAATQKAHEVHSARDGVTFEQSEALNRALKLSAETRSEKVDFGKHLASSVNYPPPEIINRIANLLAIRMEEEHHSQTPPSI